MAGGENELLSVAGVLVFRFPGRPEVAAAAAAAAGDVLCLFRLSSIVGGSLHPALTLRDWLDEMLSRRRFSR